eukprot:CAMPEP_0196586088 /NCGR_PEP_ID=MMETSP1081-20130531/53079_1 /TAXON_ID=36882 /ORGANISM="Pyramimonas amylifera, Strain CCMP720" /LENGTH=351 /DNA_ID=CAMNT_0041907847 /DNA_START=16 /DNA_END=1071 /DNA_ORIENTATION=+
MICAFICFLLFISEVMWHRTTITKSVLSVDTKPLPGDSGAPPDKLNIYIDITFPRVSCSIISLDTTEVSGERHMDIHDGHILKRRLDQHGEPIEEAKKEGLNKFKGLNDSEPEGPQAGSLAQKHPLMMGGGNSIANLMMHSIMGGGSLMSMFQDQFPEGIEKAFKNENNEGCEVLGHVEVNRVAGQFQVAPGKSLMLGGMTVQLAMQSGSLNMTHSIKRLAFGEGFPGAVSPLDGAERLLQPGSVHQYFLKVVPTTFVPLSKTDMSTNQYSVTESMTAGEGGVMGMGKPPGVYFSYELSPIRVSFTESRPSLLEFLTSVCAIIGGVFSVSGIIHSLIVSSTSVINKKMQVQ